MISLLASFVFLCWTQSLRVVRQQCRFLALSSYLLIDLPVARARYAITAPWRIIKNTVSVTWEIYAFFWDTKWAPAPHHKYLIPVYFTIFFFCFICRLSLKRGSCFLLNIFTTQILNSCFIYIHIRSTFIRSTKLLGLFSLKMHSNQIIAALKISLMG